MRCIVSSCDNDSRRACGKNITFFMCPTEPSLSAAWMESLRKAGLQPSPNAAVCADHFLKGVLINNDSGTYKLQDGAVPILDIQVCRICFGTNKKLYSITKYKVLYEAYESLTGLLVDSVDKLPPYLCTECANRVLNSACFRIRSIQAHLRLSELVKRHCITIETIQSITELCNPLWTDKTDNCSDYCDLNIKVIHKDCNIVSDEPEGDGGKSSGFLNDTTTLDGIRMKVDEEMQETNVEKEFIGYNVADINELDKLYKHVNDVRNNTENVESIQSVTTEDCISNSGTVVTSNLHQDSISNCIDLRDTNIANKACQDVVIEDINDIAKYNLYRNIAIERIKTEDKKEIEQLTFGNKSPGIDGLVAVPNVQGGVVEDRVKPNFDEKNDRSDPKACANINTSPVTLTNTSKDKVCDNVMTENQEAMEQSITVENVPSNVEDTSSLQEGSAGNSYNARNNVELNEDTVTMEGAGIDGSIVTSTIHLDEVTAHSIREQLANEISNIVMEILDGEVPEEPGIEINEEIKECIALEKDASRVDSVIDSQEKAVDSGCVENDEDFIIYYNIVSSNDTVSIISSSYVKNAHDSVETECKDAGNEGLQGGACNSIDRTPLTGEIPSLDGRLDSEETRESVDTPDDFNGGTTVAVDQQTEPNYGVLLADKFSCEMCHFETGSEIQLLSHLKAHAAKNVHTCDVCNYKTVHGHSLRVHMLVHSGKRAYTCDVCKRLFSRKGHLRSHLLMIHADHKPYQCDICKTSFGSKSSLRTHMPKHFGNNLYTCKICAKTFVRKEHFKTHRRVHSGDRPYGCDVCKRSFSRKDDLKNHLISHSGKKPYECAECGKAYSYKRNLILHLRVHSAESAFSCEVCGRPFGHKHTLRHHLRTHSGEKPYSCPKCDKAFSRKDSLRNHLLTHSKQKEISCKICSEVFSFKRDLKRHLLEHSDKHLP